MAQTLAQLSAQAKDDVARAKAYQAVANSLAEIAKAINGTSLDTTVNSTQIAVTDPLFATLLGLGLIIDTVNAFMTVFLTYIDTGDIGMAVKCGFVDFVASPEELITKIIKIKKGSSLIEKAVGIGFDFLGWDIAEALGLNCTGYGNVMKRGGVRDVLLA
ncbi:hypothetical protein Pogu_2270 [Pyrobaculum oguniense TE7]|uniref:Uncharacterized protein n=1 Tax=Pyrobaculum oguniense (strain DSM 13380 / JCM 10595 / TE7) TaxID=698757 RepID=H6QD29_PYROT|nr:hypothetical protein Pogu_2270 [Pyrobaculum oguniense TE7]